ncbi:MAG: FHA domain-containing protein [Pseudomonadota bacterium]
MAGNRWPGDGGPPQERDDDFSEVEPATDVIDVRVRKPQRLSRPARLRQVQGPGAPRDIEWTFNKLVIGDSEGADLRIPAAGLEPRHVIFEQRHQIHFCIDLSPRAGMRLNGLHVHSCSLATGDRLEFGSVVFEFLDAEG